MAITDTLVKAFGVSKVKIFFDGDPMPYIGELTMPDISAEVIEFDNTSTGGKIEVGDPWRRFFDGDGEIMIEADSSFLASKIFDATSIPTVRASMIVNNMSQQLGTFVPQVVDWVFQCQFYSVSPGTIKQGTKREITAKFKAFTAKLDINGVNIFDYDIPNGKFLQNGVDLLTDITNLIGP